MEEKLRKEIVSLINKGMDDKDISWELEVPVSTIRFVRRQMYNNFRKEGNGDGGKEKQY